MLRTVNVDKKGVKCDYTNCSSCAEPAAAALQASGGAAGYAGVVVTGRPLRADGRCARWLGRCGSTLRSTMATSLDDLKSSAFWRGCVAEALGTLLLVVVGCGSCVGGPDWEQFAPTTLQISLAFGLAVSTSVWCLSHVAGAGHINPAVTVGMLVAGRVSVARAVLFVAAQCVGAVAGAGLLKALTPPAVQAVLGTPSISPALTVEQGFGVEFVATFVLVLTVFASTDPDRPRREVGPTAPLSIGLSVTLCHLFAIKYTGSSMNPARAFGPALIVNSWEHHWVYWCGPLLGGMTAAVLYEILFSVNVSIAKVRYFLFASRQSDRQMTSSSTTAGVTSSRSRPEASSTDSSCISIDHHHLHDEQEMKQLVHVEARV